MNKHLLRLVVLICVLCMPMFSATAQTPEAATGPSTAFGPGIGEPATFFDDRGNPIMEIVVTGVEVDWQDYDEFSAPERGKVYVKVDLALTNLTDRAETFSPYSLLLIDSTGLMAEQGYFADIEGLMVEDVPVDAGGTVEGSVVYALYAEVQPLMLVWQPDYTMYVFIYLGE